MLFMPPQAMSPGASAPPPVGPVSLPGNDPCYARADHTHASSVQAARVPVVGAMGLLTWTYPIPYDSGVFPIVVPTPEIAPGSTQPLTVCLVGRPNNVSATLQVFRAMPTTLPTLAASVPGTVINPFGFAPDGTYVNLIARKPS